MKTIKFKGYHATHFETQDEIQILGGTVVLNPEELEGIAQKFQIEEYQVKEQKMYSAEREGYEFSYYSYVLFYGPRSIHHPKHPRNNKTENK